MLSLNQLSTTIGQEAVKCRELFASFRNFQKGRPYNAEIQYFQKVHPYAVGISKLSKISEISEISKISKKVRPYVF